MAAYNTDLGISGLDVISEALNWDSDLLEVYNVSAELGRRNQKTSPAALFTNAAPAFYKTTADTAGYVLSLSKSRSGGIITSGDTLGTIAFRGHDGVGYITNGGASIRAISSGTIGATRVPSSLIFATATDASPSVLTDRLTIDSAGVATFSGRIVASSPIQQTSSESTSGFIIGSGGAGSFKVGSAGTFEWSSGAAVNSASDVLLSRDAGATLSLRNTTVAAQTFRIYETTNAGLTNYSRLSLQTQAGNHLIRTEAAGTAVGGTGLPRILQIGSGPSNGTNIAGASTIIHGGQGTGSGAAGAILFQQSLPVGGSGAGVTALATTWQISTAGHLLAGTDNTYDIGASGATRPKNVYVAGEVTAGARMTLGADGIYGWTARCVFASPADSIILIRNSAENNFDRLQFGGTASSFPALKRSSAELHCRLADDSADATFQALTYKVATVQVVGAQGAAVADASGGAVIDAEARTALNALLARLRTHGLIAT